MDEIREVKVTDTHIQHFECGCTTTVKKTTLEGPAPTSAPPITDFWSARKR